MEKLNPKALNLEKLSSEHNKITLGFKCPPQLKLQLAKEAQGLNISLSEYVESIVLNYKDAVAIAITPLKSKVDFYENEILKRLYEENKGQTLGITTATGETLAILILSIQDIYSILINSFKTQN